MPKIIAVFIFLLISFSSLASLPLAKGISGDLKWEVRLNFPDCDHSDKGKLPGVWCGGSSKKTNYLTGKDEKKSNLKNGIIAKLQSWVDNPKVKSIHVATFSFSNRKIKKMLCDATKRKKNPLNLTMIIDQSYDYLNNPNKSGKSLANKLAECPRTKVQFVGIDYNTGNGHLQHMKIFLAAEEAQLEPLKKQPIASTLRFSSSSANFSSWGPSIYFENFIFFESPTQSYLSQQHVCVFEAFANAEKNKKGDQRRSFELNYSSCVAQITTQKRSDIDFLVVPGARLTGEKLRPYDALKKMVLPQQKKITDLRVAIHRLTTGKIYKKLFKESVFTRGTNLKVIFDDDSLRVGVKNGGGAHDMSKFDIFSYRSLREVAEIGFMETNGEVYTSYGSKSQLFHNKFAVAQYKDGSKTLFQGAGNFTAKAFNISGKGNYEYYYLITIPELAQAYWDGWNELWLLASYREDHPVGQQRDLSIEELRKKFN